MYSIVYTRHDWIELVLCFIHTSSSTNQTLRQNSKEQTPNSWKICLFEITYKCDWRLIPHFIKHLRIVSVEGVWNRPSSGNCKIWVNCFFITQLVLWDSIWNVITSDGLWWTTIVATNINQFIGIGNDTDKEWAIQESFIH